MIRPKKVSVNKWSDVVEDAKLEIVGPNYPWVQFEWAIVHYFAVHLFYRQNKKWLLICLDRKQR